MCGRFSLAITADMLKERFELPAELLPALEPHYNIAPAQEVAAILTKDGNRLLQRLRWGLVFSGSSRNTPAPINARMESLRDKPGFRRLLTACRCLIPADGFYEWQKTADHHSGTPYRFTLKDNELFAFAGICLPAADPATPEDTGTCAIVTTTANDLVRDVHDRMPVILPREAERLWLDPALRETERLLTLLQPYPATAMVRHRVSSLVNSPRHDSPECLRPVPEQPELFQAPSE